MGVKGSHKLFILEAAIISPNILIDFILRLDGNRGQYDRGLCY